MLEYVLDTYNEDEEIDNLKNELKSYNEGRTSFDDIKKTLKKVLTKLQFYRIINTAHEKSERKMRVCWNRQTGTFEGRVFHDVRVQVPSLAP